MIKAKTILVTSIILLISLISCYEESEGCLDLLASNYNVTAFNPCDGCCTYPKVAVTIKHLWNDTTLVLGDTLYSADTDSFSIIDSRFYLSQFDIKLVDDSRLDFLEDLKLKIGTDSVGIPKDVVLIRKTQTSGDINTYRLENVVKQFEFRLGLDDILNPISAVDSEQYKPIEHDNNMRSKDQYASYYFKLAKGLSFKDTIELYILDDFKISKEISIPTSKGATLSLPIVVNYNEWFRDVSFLSSSDSLVTEIIKGNTTDAFR